VQVAVTIRGYCKSRELLHLGRNEHKYNKQRFICSSFLFSFLNFSVRPAGHFAQLVTCYRNLGCIIIPYGFISTFKFIHCTFYHIFGILSFYLLLLLILFYYLFIWPLTWSFFSYLAAQTKTDLFVCLVVLK
jgi:hypothetical protein